MENYISECMFCSAFFQVSGPWTDIKIAAEELEDKYVYVWKPNPSILAMESFDEDLVKKTIKNGFEVVSSIIS